MVRIAPRPCCKRLGIVFLTVCVLMSIALPRTFAQELPFLEMNVGSGLTSLGWSVVKMSISLVVVLGLLLWTLKVVTRRGPARTRGHAGPSIEVLSQQRLEPGKTLYLVECLGRYAVVGTFDKGMQLIFEGASPPSALRKDGDETELELGSTPRQPEPAFASLWSAGLGATAKKLRRSRLPEACSESPTLCGSPKPEKG